jgi:hypothetical protein
MGKRKADKAEGETKRKKRRRGRSVRRLVFLIVVGGVGALVLSEDARDKALDALFGSEEEFQYSAPTPPVGDAGSSEAV